ncbi:MarR family winged helix-turn-helix transcriptional regulator [Mycolicibacterium sp. 120266]|uniref:MarR family winged helix-turn-helix transcriptional regulator n=1 Tax=Mycolicibacterium sp. 120266 TaxID=3090601 RepID=UPI00299DC0C1|nr:MarR family winged helix-turn-helix transcriptional regulator [Mycolicibacterium sp. 120266]MDX1873810.1 MarR family winged helix-turn-helix transcriptional regulator [Mycolicibacterium sp. 120266]
MPSTTSLESLSEVMFGVERWWNGTLSNALFDADVANLDGWRVLGALRSGDGLTMSELSAGMAIAPPTLTRIVDKLVDGGFVLRRVDAMDRRRVLVYLSARGKTKVRKLIRHEGWVKSTLVEEFGEEAAVALVRGLSRLAQLSVPAVR